MVVVRSGSRAALVTRFHWKCASQGRDESQRPVPRRQRGAPMGSEKTSTICEMVAPAGGDQPHNNMMPYLTFNFCIALQGVFPPRT